MADMIYTSFASDVMSGAINLATDALKVMLVSSKYVPNKAEHARRSDVMHEVNGPGYTTGGTKLTGVSVSIDPDSGAGLLNADDTVWKSATLTARGAIVYKSLGGSAVNDPLIRYVDFGTDKTSTEDAFSVRWKGVVLEVVTR